jgi:hypothetical protein
MLAENHRTPTIELQLVIEVVRPQARLGHSICACVSLKLRPEFPYLHFQLGALGIH